MFAHLCVTIEEMAQNRWVVTMLCGFAAGGCVRDPLPEVCPTQNAGQLVISEVRGDQTASTDTLGQWIEIYNASSSSIDLAGLTVRLKRKDGGATANILITRTLNVAAHGYVTLGRFADDETRPAHIDYGYDSQVTAGLYSAGAIDLLSCETLIDRVIYDSLPRAGTYNLSPAGGEPSATANDQAASWCTDPSGSTAGTPKGANNPCP